MEEWLSHKEAKAILTEHVDNRDFIVKAIDELRWPNPQMAAFPEKICDDEEIVYQILMTSCAFVEEAAYVSDRLKKDKDFIRKIVNDRNAGMRFLSVCDESITGDREFILSLDLPNNSSYRSSSVLEYLSPKLQDDEEIVYQCCQAEVGSIRHASARLKNDKEFVLSILNFRNCTGSIDYILEGEPILQDPDFVKRAYIKTGEIDFKDVPDEIKNDLEMVYRALNGKYMPYYYCEDAIMSMYYVASPFSGVYNLHISRKILDNPDFAKLIADKFFASKVGQPHIDRYPHEKITDIYKIMDEIALDGHLYWYNESPECVFDFTKEIEELSGGNICK